MTFVSSRDPPSAQPTNGVVCPHCGHELSMFAEPIADRAENVASKVADAVGSWWFLLVLITVSGGWIVVNLLGARASARRRGLAVNPRGCLVSRSTSVTG
jgi:hypothetical protein